MKTPPFRSAAALAACALCTLLAACQKTTTTTETPSGTTTTTTYSTPAMPELGASASRAASQAVAGASQALGVAGEKLGDAAVTAKVKAALLTAAEVKAMQIDVDTHDGVVTLTGTQDSAPAIDRAAGVARGTDGVKSVENRLAVKAP